LNATTVSSKNPINFPVLRNLQYSPLKQGDEQFIVLWDPSGLSSEKLVIPLNYFYMFQFFDGEHGWIRWNSRKNRPLVHVLRVINSQHVEALLVFKNPIDTSLQINCEHLHMKYLPIENLGHEIKEPKNLK